VAKNVVVLVVLGVRVNVVVLVVLGVRVVVKQVPNR